MKKEKANAVHKNGKYLSKILSRSHDVKIIN